jgi:TonB-dependent siderophore receptor
MSRVHLAALLILATPLRAQDATGTSSDPRDQAQAPAGSQPRYEETVDVEAELPAIPPSAAAATRVPVPVESLPVAISVVPRSVFVEQDAFVLSDALKNASGTNTMPGFGVFDFFVIRGFDSLSSGLVVVDGAPEPEATFYPLYNVRQVEVLKGPAGFLYGGSPLAAAVHLVRKQAGGGRFAEGSLTYGRFGSFAATADGNLASADGSLAFRLNGVWQGSDGYRDNSDASLRGINPGFVWKPDARSRVALSFEYVRSEAQPDTGIPFVGESLAPVPRTRSYQSPLDKSDQDLYRLRLDAQRQFGTRLTLRNKFYFTDLNWDSDGTLILGAFPGPQGRLLVGRVLTILDDRQKLLGNQLEAALTFKTGGVAHDLVAGFELYRLRDTFVQDVALIPPIDLQEPVEFTRRPVITEPAFGLAGDSRSLVLAPYLLDRVTFSGKLSAFAGARLDRLDYDDPGNETLREATKLSPLAGLVFAPRPRVSLYLSGGTAFAPPSTQVVGPRDPEESRQLEAGAKTTFLGGKGYAGLAVYHLERDNIAIPDSTGRTSQLGDQRSRGIELDLSAEFLPGWVTYAAYAFTDAELTSFAERVQLPTPPFFAVLDRSGNRPGFAPRHLASVWTSKTLDRLTLAAGARFVSEQFIAEDNAFKVDDYVLLDAAASYRVGRARFSLNFKNLTGTEYETRGFGAAAAVPARPFEVLGRIELAVGGR